MNGARSDLFFHDEHSLEHHDGRTYYYDCNNYGNEHCSDYRYDHLDLDHTYGDGHGNYFWHNGKNNSDDSRVYRYDNIHGSLLRRLKPRKEPGQPASRIRKTLLSELVDSERGSLRDQKEHSLSVRNSRIQRQQ